ncbi:hypothetical protein CRENPOLYSF1_80047 [Crenothrix polyspora]|uniref:Uncharacterized protein n=1 Tax=Crenothrix polyspora TaxID=360316 RepID=A0A1R4HI53_9GAMM|nr:hypothetical protein CRENPOLYSF1_80047 [Crenothrix polyspora]
MLLDQFPKRQDLVTNPIQSYSGFIAGRLNYLNNCHNHTLSLSLIF